MPSSILHGAAQRIRDLTAGRKPGKTRSRRARHHTTTTDEITHDTSLCHTTPGRSYCLCFIIPHGADMRKLFVVLQVRRRVMLSGGEASAHRIGWHGDPDAERQRSMTCS